jgi:hypothetical protein
VPGLLQTEDYARAVIAQGHDGVSPELVERRLCARMSRQKVLEREQPAAAVGGGRRGGAAAARSGGRR